MKYYSAKIIKEFLELYKDEIESISLGMEEDWSWTSETYYVEPQNDWNNSLDNLDLSDGIVCIAGITGSTWATPVMEYRLKDGTRGCIDCYYDDMRVHDESQIAMQKAFALGTGGMDRRY